MNEFENQLFSALERYDRKQACKISVCSDDCDLTHCKGCGCHMLLWDREPSLAVCQHCNQRLDDGDDIMFRILEQCGILKRA